MKSFLKTILASVIGVIIANILLLGALLSIITLISVISTGRPNIPSNTLYCLKLEGKIVERKERSPLDIIFPSNLQETGLNQILHSIKKAKDNSFIKGIYIEAGDFSASPASLEEIRQALLNFHTSGKPIIAYADNYSQSAYYLCSVADKIYLHPNGRIDWKGIAATPIFFTDLLDKLGVKMQIFRVGSFKSAVEPFSSISMSRENRDQTNIYLKSIWSVIVDNISNSRNISPTILNRYADEHMKFVSAEKYINYGLVDSLLYIDQVKIELGKISGESENNKINMLFTNDMINFTDDSNQKFIENRIALYYAYGEIDGVSDYYSQTNINSDVMCRELASLRNNKNIKAVVVRVNSPGGSAFGSEKIWREMKLLADTKPLVVSMGDYAASGGYYISSPAHIIVAQNTSITGSIGIFGMIPDISELFNNKLGLYMDIVKTNLHTDLGVVNRGLNITESEMIQAEVNLGYELFINRCSEGRDKDPEDIKTIAEGKIWTGMMAMEIGLVDTIGGIEEAIELARNLAEVESYKLIEYPLSEPFLLSLLNNTKNNYFNNCIKRELGMLYEPFCIINSFTKMDRIQALTIQGVPLEI
ncbi:MAG TPA: signal peptide peptidase SppA [Bacteroidaceae bacterium]|nr:signal peptide peptidase SppA [Bacteroidaceae bacterium]